ncbi:MAG: ABC transporter ATP-binding protein [Coprococcus sp.]
MHRITGGEIIVMKSLSVLFRMWNLVRKQRVRFYIGFLIGSTSIFFFRFLDSFLVQEFMEVCVGGNQAMLVKSLITVSGMVLFGIIVYPIIFGLVYTTYSIISGEVKKKIFDKAFKTKLSYIESEYSGELVTRITADFNDAIQLVAYPVVGQGNPFALVFAIVMIAVVILYKSPLLGVISLALTAINLLIVRYMIIPLREKEKKTKEVTGKAAQNIVDSLSGSMVSKMFGLKSMLVEQYENSTEEIYRNNLSLIKKKSFLNLMVDTQSFISFICVCVIGLFLCTKDIISIPDVIFISTLQMSLGSFVRQFSDKVSAMQKYIVGAKRLFDFLDAPEEIQREELAQPQMDASEAIGFHNISFCYPESEHALFENFSLTVKNGEKIGIAGGSGGGKSTLMKLLLEFVETDKGHINIFGNDMQKYSQNQVRDLFSYVPQDCYLFDGTIRENIVLGKESVTDEEVMNAIENAYLSDFVNDLPEGLETRVGERGCLLSGGQRQRVAIARAFLKNSPILLLDEATSALDSQSEEIVQKAIERLMANRTSIVIAHRLSTIQNMDRIVVIEKGHIEESGTHTELLAKKGRYYQLYCM